VKCMKKLKMKFMTPSNYKGTVRTISIIAQGRKKREAVKRLRKIFARRGIPTQPSPLEDLLVVEFLGKKES
jgi:hypothetical protein